MKNTDLFNLGFNPEKTTDDLGGLCGNQIPDGIHESRRISAEDFMNQVNGYGLLNSQRDIGRQRALLKKAGYTEIEGVPVEQVSNEKVHDYLRGQYALAFVGMWDY